MSRVDDPQGELSLVRDADPLFVPTHEQIRGCRTQGQAVELAVRASGLDDKEVYMDPSIKIDPGTWSKIKNDRGAEMPPSLIKAFCVRVKNVVLLEWICWQQGRTAVVIETEAERRAAQALADKRRAEEEIAILRDVITQMAGGRKA